MTRVLVAASVICTAFSFPADGLAGIALALAGVTFAVLGIRRIKKGA